MICIITYDIENNSTRTKLARFLLGKGTRIQKSVFAIEFERHSFSMILKRIKQIINDSDKVAIFRLCKGCKKNALKVPKDENTVHVY